MQWFSLYINNIIMFYTPNWLYVRAVKVSLLNPNHKNRKIQKWSQFVFFYFYVAHSEHIPGKQNVAEMCHRPVTSSDAVLSDGQTFVTQDKDNMLQLDVINVPALHLQDFPTYDPVPKNPRYPRHPVIGRATHRPPTWHGCWTRQRSRRAEVKNNVDTKHSRYFGKWLIHSEK